ncbi:GNAT family N-acetyltransferase [Exilibacterium tricleocarpae]|uniref:GNAT family N-acetyltransferase n=1 Tax=Exilibacterium tricleocarpae TaxID=2591008 RepID=A0A545T3H9_9GAMM|nr:GNAT family N-acetyltransferase [Exilibacterium tricleocarpae]TQV71774.1 GNAT family N-acetyltransferase [Exilibacterium tricleocarpae]
MNIQPLTIAEFRDFRAQWNTLLENSAADPLFLSWEWMYNWWLIFGNQPRDELFILTARDAAGELIGLAPLYVQTRPLFNGMLRSRRLQFLGSSCLGVPGFRTENMQLISRQGQEETVVRALLDFTFQHRHFDECMFSDLDQSSCTYRLLTGNLQNYKCLPRTQSISTTYEIDCDRDFQGFVAALGKNTRLKAFNRRKVLEEQGEIALSAVASDSIEKVFTPFATFYKQRWGQSAHHDKQQAFLTALAAAGRISTGGLLLTVDGKAIACTIDAIYADTVYNIQTGFIDGYHKKISLGTLMLGYAVEQYCSQAAIKNYDLLAGTGKNSNYKERLAAPGKQLESLQLIRANYLKFIYRSKDFLFSIKRKLKG